MDLSHSYVDEEESVEFELVEDPRGPLKQLGPPLAALPPSPVLSYSQLDLPDPEEGPFDLLTW